MPIINLKQLQAEASRLGFDRDPFEKMVRLVDVLDYFSTSPFLSSSLALKGGTAINLTVVNIPRLSVDIDLDYCRSMDRETMLADRELIDDKIRQVMSGKGYVLSPDSKKYHALDSYVFSYVGAGGGGDKLKIEINYMLRCHVMPECVKSFEFPMYSKPISVKTLDKLDLYGAKIVALINRGAIRDLFDISKMIESQVFTPEEETFLRKCVAFYLAIASETIPEKLSYEKIDGIKPVSIKKNLAPLMLKSGWPFKLNAKMQLVVDYFDRILVFDPAEVEFLNAFRSGSYRPDLLFSDPEIVRRVENHPMALWKCRAK